MYNVSERVAISIRVTVCSVGVPSVTTGTLSWRKMLTLHHRSIAITCNEVTYPCRQRVIMLIVLMVLHAICPAVTECCCTKR